MAETSKDAEAAFDAFIAAYQLKYDKAAECLAKDRQALLAFYDFPAEHWKHLRTSNPIESTFATVRHRTIRSKGCLSNKTALAMVFKLVGAGPRNATSARQEPPAQRSGSRSAGGGSVGLSPVRPFAVTQRSRPTSDTAPDLRARSRAWWLILPICKPGSTRAKPIAGA